MFPPAHRDFLLNPGASCFYDTVVFQPEEPSPWADQGCQSFDWFYGPSDGAAHDLVAANRRLTDVIPLGAFAIGHDPGGNQVVLDSIGGVRFLDVESGPIVWPRSFEEFLQSFRLAPE